MNDYGARGEEKESLNPPESCHQLQFECVRGGEQVYACRESRAKPLQHLFQHRVIKPEHVPLPLCDRTAARGDASLQVPRHRRCAPHVLLALPDAHGHPNLGQLKAPRPRQHQVFSQYRLLLEAAGHLLRAEVLGELAKVLCKFPRLWYVQLALIATCLAPLSSPHQMGLEEHCFHFGPLQRPLVLRAASRVGSKAAPEASQRPAPRVPALASCNEGNEPRPVAAAPVAKPEEQVHALASAGEGRGDGADEGDAPHLCIWGGEVG